MTADGWKFVGDTKELNNLMKISASSINEFKQEFDAANTAGEKITNSRFGSYFSEGVNEKGTTLTTGDKYSALVNIGDANTRKEILKASNISEDAWNDIMESTSFYWENGVFNYEEWAKNNSEYAS
jgi:hypothetical protein